MNRLELKIPPLLLVVIIGALMWLVSSFTPSAFVSNQIGLWFAGGVFLVGILFCVLGVLSFKNAETTVNPMKPEESSALVTSGIYGVTRNPMYVGFLLFLISWSFFLANIFALLLATVFILYMNKFQIKPEEKMLQKIFGQEFTEYTKRVRRWL